MKLWRVFLAETDPPAASFTWDTETGQGVPTDHTALFKTAHTQLVQHTQNNNTEEQQPQHNWVQDGPGFGGESVGAREDQVYQA